MMQSLKKPGFRQFLARTIVFFFILFGVQLSIFLFFSKTAFFRKYLVMPNEFYIQFLTGLSKQDFLNSFIFVVVAFLLWRRKDILNFSGYKQNKKQTIIFSVLAVFVLASHYVFKYWVVSNLQLALSYITLITLLKYSFNIAFVVILAFAVYNIKFIKLFLKSFYKDIAFFSVVLFLFYKLIGFFQDSWLFFSTIVGKILYYLFSRVFDDVTFRISPTAGPILGVGDFRVAISKVCSGIDSLLFFISLFAILVVLNWKEINKKRMAVLFIPGVIGTFILNIIRVFLIIWIGVKISPEFAVDLFHTNAGWILFLGYFIAFWHFGSKWVLVSSQNKK